MKKKWTILLAVVLTLFFAVFQRMTGPTHPAGGKVEVNGETLGFSLPRSGVVGKDTRLEIPAAMNTLSGATPQAQEYSAYLYYCHYPMVEGDGYHRVPMTWEDGKWIGYLPSQPMAGKLAYYVEADGNSFFADEPLIIRYRGNVPAWVLVPHILLMFLAMYFACMAGLGALTRQDFYKRYTYLTLIALLIGGFIFGCLVQKYAFGVYWAGFPIGTDLTDNKTLLALLAFLVAWGVLAFRKNARWVVLVASIVMLGVFCVPHSLGGSELNRQTGSVESAR